MIFISKPNQVEVTCDNCGKIYHIKESQYIKSKNHFCCFQCKSDFQKNRIQTTCENCGKQISQKASHYNSREHHFCSMECQAEFRHKHASELRRCIICGKLFEVNKSSTQRLCSNKCQIEWQKTRVGRLNPKYARVSVHCDYCGKEFDARRYKTQNGQRLFCSDECSRKMYAEVTSQSPEYREQSRRRAIQMLVEHKIDTNTKPQRIVNQILDDLGIEYVNEADFKYYSADNYLPIHNLIIEVMGDFWHGNPNKYCYRFNDIQSKTEARDKAKHTYIKKYHNIEILYLWEDDLYNRPFLCQKLIEEYIDRHGILDNYHSFNYHLEDDHLQLNDEIIKAHFDKSLSNEESVETVIQPMVT